MPITATYGDIVYHDDDRIEVPITFGSIVHVLEVSDCFITGADFIDSYVKGFEKEYALFLTPEEDTFGTFDIDITGRVYTSDGDADAELDTVDSQIISINYNTIEPDIISRLIPPTITAGINSVYIILNRDVINITPQSFDILGVDVGAPVLYSAPNDNISNYTQHINSDNPRRYFRLDFEVPNPPPIGSLNIRLKKNEAIGYVDKTPRLRDRPDTSSQRSRRQILGQQAPPSISSAYLKDATLYLLEDFRHNIVISNSSSLTKVYVEGLLRGWTYEWTDTKKENLAIVADGEDITRVESGVWTIRLEYGSQSRDYKLNWRVAQRAPVITNPGFQTFYTETPINLDIKISHDPSVSMDGLLTKMKYAKQEGGAKLSGIPDRLISKSENRKIIINASTSGGSDVEEFGFDIVEFTFDANFSKVGSLNNFGTSETLNTAFGFAVLGDRAYLNINRKLFSINLTTGQASRVGSQINYGLSSSEFPMELVSDGTNLYLITFNRNSRSSSIHRVDTTSGAVSRVSTITSSVSNFDASRGNAIRVWSACFIGSVLYIVADNNNSSSGFSRTGLFRIDDISNGQTTRIGSSNIIINVRAVYGGLVYAGGTMYLFNASSTGTISQLYTINISTGDTSRISTGVGFLASGADFYNGVMYVIGRSRTESRFNALYSGT